MYNLKYKISYLPTVGLLTSYQMSKDIEKSIKKQFVKDMSPLSIIKNHISKIYEILEED